MTTAAEATKAMATHFSLKYMYVQLVLNTLAWKPLQDYNYISYLYRRGLITLYMIMLHYLISCLYMHF